MKRGSQSSPEWEKWLVPKLYRQSSVEENVCTVQRQGCHVSTRVWWEIPFGNSFNARLSPLLEKQSFLKGKISNTHHRLMKCFHLKPGALLPINVLHCLSSPFLISRLFPKVEIIPLKNYNLKLTFPWSFAEFKKTLEEAIRSDTSGHFQRLLISLSQVCKRIIKYHLMIAYCRLYRGIP